MLNYPNLAVFVNGYSVPLKTSLIDYMLTGLRGLCLDCHQGNITKGFFRLKEHCSICGGKVERNNGDSWAFLIFIDRAVFLFPLIVALFFRLNLKVFIVSSIIMTICLTLFTSRRLSLSIAIERWLSGKFEN